MHSRCTSRVNENSRRRYYQRNRGYVEALSTDNRYTFPSIYTLAIFLLSLSLSPFTSRHAYQRNTPACADIFFPPRKQLQIDFVLPPEQQTRAYLLLPREIDIRNNSGHRRNSDSTPVFPAKLVCNWNAPLNETCILHGSGMRFNRSPAGYARLKKKDVTKGPRE